VWKLSPEKSGQPGPELLEPGNLLRAIARAVANAQHDLDAHHRAVVLAGKGVATDQTYRIAELLIKYKKGGSGEGPGRSRAVLLRVAPSAHQVGLLAELLIDGRTKEALVIS